MLQENKCNGSSIAHKGERIATLMLTVRAATTYSPHEDALRLMYTELLLSGAGKLSREGWLHELGNLGSTIQVSLDDGNIDFSLHAIDTSLSKTLALFATLFSDPHLTEIELDRIQKYVTNKLLLAKEDARSRAYQMFLDKSYAKTDRRMLYTIDSLLSEIPLVSIAEIKAFHASLWSYPWLYTSGGSIETNMLITNAVEKIFRINIVEIVPEYNPPKTIITKGISVFLQDVPNKQNIEFSIGGSLSLTQNSEAYAPFVFGMSVLALPGGFTGRLMSTVREKEGLTYNIYGKSEDVSKSETGIWRIATFFAPKDAVQGITSTFREIALISKKGITDDELKRFKVILHTRHSMIDDSLLKKVGEAHALKKIGLSESEYMSFKERIQTMKTTDVNQTLSMYLNPKNIIVSGAGPIKRVEKLLKQFNT